MSLTPDDLVSIMEGNQVRYSLNEMIEELRKNIILTEKEWEDVGIFSIEDMYRPVEDIVRPEHGMIDLHKKLCAVREYLLWFDYYEPNGLLTDDPEPDGDGFKVEVIITKIKD